MAEPRTCAVIPAAGRGTRLGSATPKIMVEVAGGVTVWDLLYRRLRPHVAHVHVVVSPDGEAPFRELAAARIAAGEVSVSVQHRPEGMGDAVFGAARFWAAYDAILVVWGDQANLSPETVGRVAAAHRSPGLTVPLVAMPDPYVEYELDRAGPAAGPDRSPGGTGDGETRLVRVRMSREGDPCRPGGLSDVGVFCLATAGLRAAWRLYLAGAAPGAVTGEVNFLPFLSYLSRVRDWPFRVVPVTDPQEARGINTPEDLEFARQAFLRCPG
ncbi:hypothetical protein Sru01_23420 [Sphaerisporangium rufum]|uniref:MobA-like NTP transferase domain-containing protein n=1 Tax=Sphaerisporangium rufum TaxID=1381558 RepID=A0A919R548_9ACTN|nr:NTP transferase domain-containing protein [Sphaerisporangium rufum]GII77360.1 hypothetical protein Sru01_23420 [Sphaerisporangium rufum]